MKKSIMVFMAFLMMSIPFTFALSAPQTYNGKTYYQVTSTDPTEDTGDEVCGKAGMVCVGYTETTSAVCKLYNPNAAVVSGQSGDASATYCNGAPQNGICSVTTNSCLECPTCSNGVSCGTPIGGLYREMYVECAAPSSGSSCTINFNAKTTNDLLNQIGSLNAQLASCPQSTPSGTGAAISNGETQIDIQRTNGQTSYVTITRANGLITGVKSGASASCKQKITISEADLDTALQSPSIANAFAYLFGQKKAKISGCSFLSGTRLFFVGPIARFFARKQAPTAPTPTPPPAPNCGYAGEQCNNRGCFTGICAGEKIRASDGRWVWDYKCIEQRQYDALCVGRGNSPPAMSCITSMCR